MPTMIPNSNFGANINVTKNVIIDITASCFWTRQAYFIGLNLMRLITAVIMTAAKVACGMWYKSGVKNNSVIPITIPVTTDENPVTAPAVIFTADLEKDPETG